MTAGRNKGKKYVKLQGFEQPTPQSEEHARRFLEWYGDNFDRLRDKLIFGHLYDDEVATDTALMVYDNIALKRFIVADYQAYFLRAYHTNRIAKAKRKTYKTSFREALVYINEEAVVEGLRHGDPTRLANLIEAITYRVDSFDMQEYEQAVEKLNSEMLEYVRANYDPFSVSMFEIYTGLLPDTSYKRLSVLLGVPVTRIWTSIGEIRKDLAERFQSRKDFLLSLD